MIVQDIKPEEEFVLELRRMSGHVIGKHLVVVEEIEACVVSAEGCCGDAFRVFVIILGHQFLTHLLGVVLTLLVHSVVFIPVLQTHSVT